MKLLKHRVDELVKRTQQLSALLRNAGITIPVVTGSIAASKPNHWDNKIRPDEVDVLMERVKSRRAEARKLKVETIKKKADRAQPAKTRRLTNLARKRPLLNTSNLPSTQSKPLVKSTNKNVKQTRKKSTTIKNIREKPTVSQMLGLTLKDIEIPNLKPSPQHFIVINNSSSLTSSVVKPSPCFVMANMLNQVVSKPHLLTAPIMASRVQTSATIINQNPSIARLGPGTLILANGNIVPVNPQSQTVLTPLLMNNPNITTQNKPVFMMNNNVVTTGSSFNVQVNNSQVLSTGNSVNPGGNSPTKGQKNLTKLIPKPHRRDTTKTTNSNKVPIPSLTSRLCLDSLDEPLGKVVPVPRGKKKVNVKKKTDIATKKAVQDAVNVEKTTEKLDQLGGQKRVAESVNDTVNVDKPVQCVDEEERTLLFNNTVLDEISNNISVSVSNDDKTKRMIPDKETILILGKRKCDDDGVEKIVETKQLKLDETVNSKENKVLITNKSKDDEPIKYVSNTVAKISNSGSYTIDALCKLKTTVERIGKDDTVSTEYVNEEKIEVSDSISQKVDVSESLLDRPMIKIIPEKENTFVSLKNGNEVIVPQEKQNVPTSTCQAVSTFGNLIPPKTVHLISSKLPMSSCKSISSENKSVERIETAISIGSSGLNLENASTQICSAIDVEKTKNVQSNNLSTPVIYSSDITKTTPSVKLVTTESAVLKSTTTVTIAPTQDIEMPKTSTSNLGTVEPNYSQSKLFESTSYCTDIFSKSNSVLALPTRENETTFSKTLLPIIADRPIYSQSKTFVPSSYTSNVFSKSTELSIRDVSTAKTFTTLESVPNDYIFVPSSTIAQTPTFESRTIFSSIGQDKLSVYPQTKMQLEPASTKTFMALGSDKPTFSQSKVPVFHSTSFTNDDIFPKSATIASQIPMRDIPVTKTFLSTESNKSSYSQNKMFVPSSFTNDNIFFKSATTMSSQAMETTKSYVSIANDKPTYSQSKPFAPTSFPNKNIFLKATTGSQVPTRETETAKVFVTSDKPTYSQSKVFVPTSFSNDNIFLKSSSTIGLPEIPAQETETSKTFMSIDSGKPTYSQTKVLVPTSFSSDNIFLKTSSSIPTSLHYFPPITAANAFNSIPHSDANTFVPISNDPLDAKSYENDSVNVHSSLSLAIQNHEFSNDIFASLQVPSGGQHPESISPTAAFLLAFPLVSTSKVTELIDAQDEAGSDSLQGTSTLLQIGNIDSESNIVSCIPRSSSNQTKDTRFAVKNSESEKMVSVQTSGMIEQGIFSDCVPNKSLNSKINIFEFDNSGYSSMIPPISDSFLPAIGSITKFEAKIKSNQFDSTKGASHVCDNSQKLSDFAPNKFMDFSLVQNHNVGTPCTNVTLKQPTQNSNQFQTFNKDNPFMTHMSAANPLSDMPIPKSIHQQTCTKFNVSHSVNNQLTELPRNDNYKSVHTTGSSTEPSTYCAKATDVGNAPQVKTSVYSRATNVSAQPYNYNLFDMPVITSSANNYPQVIAGNEKNLVTFPVHSSASILPWTTSTMTLPTNANQFDNFNNIRVENVEKLKVATSSVGTLPSIHEIYGNKGGRADEKPATFQNIFPNTIDERQINFAENSGQNMAQDSRGHFKYQTDIKTNQSNPMFTSKSQHNNHRPPVNWMTTPDNRQQIFTSAPNQNLVTNTVTSTSSMVTEPTHKEFEICPNQNIFSSNNPVLTPNFDSRNFNSAPFYGTGNNFYPPNSSGINCQNEQNQEQIHSSQRITDISDPLIESYSLSWNTSPRKVPFSSSAIPEVNNVFVPSTLPTLVGDLALGTNFVMNLDEHNLNKTCLQNNYAVDKAVEQRRDAKPKMEKEPVKNRGKITQDYQASGNFLSVSQLVDPQKSGVVTRSPPRRNNRNVANKQNLQRQNAPKRLAEDTRKAQIQETVPKFKRDVDRVGSFVGESLPPNSQSYQTNAQWTNTKQTRTNYKAPVSNYSAEALIGLTNNPSGETSKKVVSLPPPMVSERFSHQSYNQSRIPPFNPDILQTNYFPSVEIPQHDSQTSNHNFQNHNYNFTHTTAIPNNTVTVSSQNSQSHPSTNYIPLNSSSGFLPDLSGGNNYSSGIPDPPNFVFPPAATPLRNPTNRLTRPTLPYGAANNQYHLAVRNDANQSTNRNVCNSARRMTGQNCLKQKNVRRRLPEPIVSTTISSAIPDLGYLPMPPGVNSSEDSSYGIYLPTSQQNPVIYSTSQNLLYSPRKVGHSSHNQLAAFAPAFGQQPMRTGQPARNSQQATVSPNAANTTGTLTNFNLSTIFPEINDKHVPPASTFGTISSKNSVPPPTASVLPPPEAFSHTAPQVCRMQWS